MPALTSPTGQSAADAAPCISRPFPLHPSTDFHDRVLDGNKVFLFVLPNPTVVVNLSDVAISRYEPYGFACTQTWILGSWFLVSDWGGYDRYEVMTDEEDEQVAEKLGRGNILVMIDAMPERWKMTIMMGMWMKDYCDGSDRNLRAETAFIVRRLSTHLEPLSSPPDTGK
ncbi:hypothetical protein ONZ45_g9096 [Pleurotus djamor]|nr:hypothetical protein ONZ45_g9096 [Pleurotus djamor]